MQRLFFYTTVLVGPCYASLMAMVFGLRLLLPSEHVIHGPIEEFLWIPAVLIALALGGMAAAMVQ